MSPDVAASIKSRLLARAREQREEFERTLTRFAAERLLYRLGSSAVRDRCILKGASLLSVWLPDPYRATRDLDLLSFGLQDQESVRDLLGPVRESILAHTAFEQYWPAGGPWQPGAFGPGEGEGDG